MSHGHAALLCRLTEALDLLFLNELTDDRLEGVEFTQVSLSPDKRVVTVDYLPPENREAEVEDALPGLAPVVENRAAETLHRNPEVRFRFDRGAGNKRRVLQILDELRAKGELPPATGERDVEPDGA